MEQVESGVINSKTGLNRKVSCLKRFRALEIKTKYFKDKLQCYRGVFKSYLDNHVTITVCSRHVILYAKFELNKKDSLRLLKNEGIDVNYIDAPQVKVANNIPMMWAAGKGYRNIVQALIKAGADVNVKDEEKNTPLSYAIFEKRLSVVELLLDENIDWEYFKSNCQSAIINSIVTGQTEVVKLLIEKGIYNSLIVNGFSAVDWARKSCRVDIIYQFEMAGLLIMDK